MKFYPLKGNRQVNVNIAQYLIDWDHKVSGPQKQVTDFLRPYWKTHVVLSEFRIPSSLLRCDIVNVTTHVAIEVSPKGTHSFNRFFHHNRVKFGAAMQRELDKAAWLERNGFTLCEIFDEDLPVLSRQWFREKYNVEL